MNREQMRTALQHAPLPERMSSFDRTRAPQEPLELGGGNWLILEYVHLSEDVRFQVIVDADGGALFQSVQDGEATVLRTASLEEAGHLLRRDLLMILEEIEDEL